MCLRRKPQGFFIEKGGANRMSKAIDMKQQVVAEIADKLQRGVS